jgi:hypothetical protein
MWNSGIVPGAFAAILNNEDEGHFYIGDDGAWVAELVYQLLCLQILSESYIKFHLA